MKESMSRYMRVGLIHFMAFPETMKGEGPILDTVRKIALDEYFSAIELAWIKSSDIRRKVKETLDTAGMAIASAGQPRLLTTGMNINDYDEIGRNKAVASLKEGIDEAYDLGAEGFAFLSGKYDPLDAQAAYRQLVRSTDELCDYAAGKGKLRIALEVFDYSIDKKSLIGPVPLAKSFAEEIRARHDNFGLIVDLSHLPLIGETAREAILPVKDYIIQAHIGNCVVKDPSLPAYGDAHPRFGFPNGENGAPELAEFLSVLLECGFLNERNPPILSFEVKPFAGEDPELVITNAKRTLNRAWAMVDDKLRT